MASVERFFLFVFEGRVVSDKFIPRDISRRKRLQQIHIVSVVSTRRGQVFVTRGFFSNYLALINT